MATDTLQGRLKEAQETAQPLSRHVSDLELGLAGALQRSDYAEAQRYTDELVPARNDALLAEAHVTALSAAIAAMEEQRAEEHRQTQLAQAADRDRARLGEVQRAEQDALAEADLLLGTFFADLDAAKRHYAEALAAENTAGDARQEAADIMARLEGHERGIIGRPNRVRMNVEQDQTLVQLVRWQRMSL